MPTSQIWPTVPISELYEGLFDGPHATPKPASSGPIFLGIKNVTDDGHLDLSEVRHIDEGDFAEWTRRVEPRPGDLVFTYEATLNRYAIIPPGFRGCLGRRMALIRPNPRRVDTRFLHFYFFSPAWREVIRQNTLTGATVDRIPLTGFPDFPVHVPPLEVQRRIACILGTYDDLIENNERRIKVLDEMARALYREWFMEFRYPGNEKVPMVASAQGLIPEGWVAGSVSDFYETSSGGTPSRRNPGFYTGVNPWVKTQELQDGFILDTHEKISDEAIARSSAKMFPAQTVLVAMYGATIGQLGILALPAASNQACCAITAKPGSGHFAHAFLFFQMNKKKLVNLAVGAAQPNISQQVIRRFPMVMPPATLLATFEKHAVPLFKARLSLQRQAEVLRKTRDHLLPLLFSGQVAVREAA